MRKILLLIILLFINVNIFSNNDKDEDEDENEKISGLSSTAIVIANQYPDYLATPGDVYEVNFMVANNEKQDITAFVDNEYNIDLSFLGIVNVKGLKYTEVQEKLKDKISSSYPGSIINVMIVAPGKFKVILLGEVKEATIIEAMSLTTLSEILKENITRFASFRDIEIRSEDGTLNVYDLFQFQRYADLNNNPFLKPNDVITLRQYEKKIKLIGEVKRPGFYQLLKNDNLETLIYLYGDGLTKIAEKGRIIIESPLREETLYIDTNRDDLKSIELFDYDIVTVENREMFYPTVTIQGAISSSTGIGTNISNKISVPLTPGSKVSTVIKNMKAQFNLSSDLEKAYILRNNEKINVNLKGILEDINNIDDIILIENDRLIIPFRQLVVYVAGSVNDPTGIPYIENRTAEYYIGRAGGININENLFGTYKIRNVYGEKVKPDSIISPEDMIWVNRDNPISYVEQYGGYIATLVSTYFIVQGLYNLGEALTDPDKTVDRETILNNPTTN